MSGEFEVVRKVGRIVEIYLHNLRSAADVDAIGAAFLTAAGDLPRVIIVGDYRRASTLSPDVADRFVQVFSRSNPRIERSALLVLPEQATFQMQVERMVREANNPSRRTFRDAWALETWLAEILVPDERARVHEMLTQSREAG
jgi:hypothetical protein